MSVNSLATLKKKNLYSSIFFYILYIYISIFFYNLYSCFFAPTRETCLFPFFCGSVFSPMQKKDCLSQNILRFLISLLLYSCILFVLVIIGRILISWRKLLQWLFGTFYVMLILFYPFFFYLPFLAKFK